MAISAEGPHVGTTFVEALSLRFRLLFAGIVPLCNGCETGNLRSSAKVPLRYFHWLTMTERQQLEAFFFFYGFLHSAISWAFLNEWIEWGVYHHSNQGVLNDRVKKKLCSSFCRLHSYSTSWGTMPILSPHWWLHGSMSLGFSMGWFSSYKPQTAQTHMFTHMWLIDTHGLNAAGLSTVMWQKLDLVQRC